MSGASVGDLTSRIPKLEVPNPAKDAFENLRAVVTSYVAQAEEGLEAVITLANQPDFRGLTVSYSGTHLIVFTGVRSDGTLARVFQHVMQVNVMVSFCPLSDETPPQPEIGFLGEIGPKGAS